MSTQPEVVEKWLRFLHGPCDCRNVDEACAAIGAMMFIAEDTQKPINYVRQAQQHLATVVRRVAEFRAKQAQGVAV